MQTIVVATRSAHKLREIEEILGASIGVHLLDLDAAGIPPEPGEDGIEAFATFEENAMAKARYFASRTRHAVLADDSGLCVDALDGAPGVQSKRFSGTTGPGADEANNWHLLQRLSGVPPQERGAHYLCVLALVLPDDREMLFRGRCDGQILEEPRGEQGFGYDPLFYLPGEGRTFAEMSAAEKNRLSHRSRALSAAAAFLHSDR